MLFRLRALERFWLKDLTGFTLVAERSAFQAACAEPIKVGTADAPSPVRVSFFNHGNVLVVLEATRPLWH